MVSLANYTSGMTAPSSSTVHRSVRVIRSALLSALLLRFYIRIYDPIRIPQYSIPRAHSLVPSTFIHPVSSLSQRIGRSPADRPPSGLCFQYRCLSDRGYPLLPHRCGPRPGRGHARGPSGGAPRPLCGQHYHPCPSGRDYRTPGKWLSTTLSYRCSASPPPILRRSVFHDISSVAGLPSVLLPFVSR